MTRIVLASVSAYLLAAVACGSDANAQSVIDFEGVEPLSHVAIGGDKEHFEVTQSQSRNGSHSVRFADTVVEPYESWTYDVPFELTSGTITVWFYDVRGADAYVPHGSPVPARWGGSVIIEDKANPADFGAVEIAEMPYGPKYYATEGEVNRGELAGSDNFDSNSLPLRSVGFHRIDFHVSATDTRIFVDGLLADEVAGPGSSGNNLRLRFMYDSPSNASGGANNWVSSPAATSRGKVDETGNVPDWIYYDDIKISAELPTSQAHKLDFEISNEVADYDTAGVNQGPALPPILPNDNPNMNGFVNQWAAVTTSTAAHSGLAAARFANPPAPFKSLAFDASNFEAGTSVTLWFYDSQGQAGSYTNVRGNAIVIEEGAEPANFHAVEISTWPFPHGDSVNYYLTVGTAADGGASTLYSRGLGNRSIGWHYVEIGFYDTHSEIMVDDKVAKYIASGQSDGAIARGPGLNKAPIVRILADCAGVGRNYASTDLIYEQSYATREPFAYFDDITLPLPNSSVVNWLNY